jgi:hypothetical protein
VTRITADREWGALASCNGYAVQASDGHVGEVETPLFPPDRSEPDYLVLRAGEPLGALRPVVAAALVEEIDPLRRFIRVRGTRAEIEGLPGNLPLALGERGGAPPATWQQAAPAAPERKSRWSARRSR